MNSGIFKKAFDGFKDGIWKFTHKDAAKMLIGMGALGFALSSMAQCFAIKINDRIDKKKKNFLLLQEAADGVVNIGLFLAITSSVWKISDRLLKLTGIGKIGKNPRPVIINPDSKGHIKSGGRILTTMVASVIACNIITPLIRNFIAGKINARREQKLQNTQAVVNTVIQNQNLSPFNHFDKFALKGAQMAFYGRNNIYNSGSLKV